MAACGRPPAPREREPEGDGLAARPCWSVDFPALPLAFDRCRPGWRGHPAHRAETPEWLGHDPRDLDLVFRALATPLEPCSQPDPKTRPVPPLVALPACRPSAGYLPSRPLPTPDRRTGLTPSGRGFQPSASRSARVDSHHLDGFLRDGPAGLLHPATGRGVRRVSEPGAPIGTRRTRRQPPTSSPRRGHPSKGSPRSQPCRVTAAVAPLSLSRTTRRGVSTAAATAEAAPCARRGGPGACDACVAMLRFTEVNLHVASPSGRPRCRGVLRASPGAASDPRGPRCQVPRLSRVVAGAADFEALLHERVRCRSATVCGSRALAPPMGLCPLQGPPPRGAAWWALSRAPAPLPADLSAR
jgi:hypothetical protein